MTVLNVEYFNELDMVPDELVYILGILMILGALFCVPMFLMRTKYCTLFGILLLIASILIAIWMRNTAVKETDYISKKYVIIEDDSVPLEVFENWEIEDIKGNVYILAPRDGKKIKDEEKVNE